MVSSCTELSTWLALDVIPIWSMVVVTRPMAGQQSGAWVAGGRKNWAGP